MVRAENSECRLNLTPVAVPVGFPFPFGYLRGYKDAVDHLYAALLGGQAAVAATADLGTAAALADTAEFTWGLLATRVNQSRFSGRGIKVAVLDTGFDLDHPDFLGRSVTSKSFVTGQEVNDLNGHGTHCTGTALGFKQLAGGARRYGIAFRGDIFSGKVLSNQGSGSDSSILAGINWAITNQCRVVSMSLGAPVFIAFVIIIGRRRPWPGSCRHPCRSCVRPAS